MKKRILSLLIVLCLVLGMLPVTALASEDTEPNDTIPTAQEFEICDTLNGSISTAKDVDWYEFTLEESGCVYLNMSSYMPHYTLALHDSSGKQLWLVDTKKWDSAAGMRFDSYVFDLTEGTYYIGITGRLYFRDSDITCTGSYSLATNYINANATEVEDNDTIAHANDLPLYSSVNGQIALTDTHDFYRIVLPASGLLKLDMTAYHINYNTLALYNSEGTRLWYEDNNAADASGTHHGTYNLQLLGGTYYVKVSGERYINNTSGSDTGTYTLAADFVSANTNEVEPNSSIPNAQWIVTNKTVSAHLAINDHKDFFQFTLKEDMDLVINFTSYLNYYTLLLYNEAGDRIWYDDNNAWADSSRMRHDVYTIALKAGTYRIGVAGSKFVNSDSIYYGNYTFKLNTENPFSDVPTGSFYYDPVLWALENGITTGATATTFDPNGSCLRAHVVTFLHRAAGNPAPTAANNPFTDVKTSDFFYKPVLWAVEEGITNGVNATEFGSFANCNRAAVVTFLWRAAGSPNPKSTSNPFLDVNTTDFFYKAVLWAVENGITNGVDATHFGPTAACNRAQVVTFLYRAYN